MRSTLSSVLPVLAVAALLSGCTSIGTLKPATPAVAAFWHATLPHRGRTADLVTWWASFKYPSLDAL